MKKTVICILFILVVLMFFFSCSPQKRLNRLVRKHPELLVKDSIVDLDTFFVPAIIHDTTTNFISNDTVIIRQGKSTIKYYHDKETNNIHHYHECKADTIIKKEVIYYDKIVVKKESWFRWWFVIIALLCLGFIYDKFKKK